MTLVTLKDREGTHSCDARCYNALGDKCECICRGKNHGIGALAAERNTEAWGEQLVEEYKAAQAAAQEKRERAAGQRFIFDGYAGQNHHQAAG